MKTKQDNNNKNTTIGCKQEKSSTRKFIHSLTQHSECIALMKQSRTKATDRSFYCTEGRDHLKEG